METPVLPPSLCVFVFLRNKKKHFSHNLMITNITTYLEELCLLVSYIVLDYFFKKTDEDEQPQEIEECGSEPGS